MENPDKYLEYVVQAPALAAVLAFLYFSYKLLVKHLDQTHDKIMKLINRD